MDDPPFDLSKFDPSTLNLSHLHPAEQNRIKNRQFTSQELSLLLSGQNPWTKSGKPAPLPKPESNIERPQAAFTGDDRDFPDGSRRPLTEHREAKSKTTELKFTSDSLPSTKPESKPEPFKSTDKSPTSRGVKFIPQSRSLTAKEQSDAELRRFMPKQVREEYKKADVHRRKVIWEANRQAFEAAKKREKEKLRRDQKFMGQVFDLLQQIKEQVEEDPSKSNLLPPADASTSDLRKWYQEMQKPKPTVPFPGAVHPPGGYWVRMEENLRKRRRLLAKEEEMGRSEPFEDNSGKLLDRIDLRKREELVEREETLAREKRTDDTSPRPVEPTKPEHSSPFWAVSGFLRRWTAFGGVFLLGASWTMIQIDEFALAVVLLVAGMFAFAVQIYDWKGIENHYTATRVLKAVAGLLIIGCLVFFGAVIIKKRGMKPWSNLLAKEIRPSTTQAIVPNDCPITVNSEIVARLYGERVPIPPPGGQFDAKFRYMEMFYEWKAVLGECSTSEASLTISHLELGDRIQIFPSDSVISEPKPQWASGFDEPARKPDWYYRTIKFTNLSPERTALVAIRRPVNKYALNGWVLAEPEMITITDHLHIEPIRSFPELEVDRLNKQMTALAQWDGGRGNNKPIPIRGDPGTTPPIGKAEATVEARCANKACDHYNVGQLEIKYGGAAPRVAPR